MGLHWTWQWEILGGKLLSFFAILLFFLVTEFELLNATSSSNSNSNCKSCAPSWLCRFPLDIDKYLFTWNDSEPLPVCVIKLQNGAQALIFIVVVVSFEHTYPDIWMWNLLPLLLKGSPFGSWLIRPRCGGQSDDMQILFVLFTRIRRIAVRSTPSRLWAKWWK